MATREDARLGPNLTSRTLIASAQTTWYAYIFLRRNAASGNGHTAFGFQNNRDGYTCGGVENYHQGIRASQIGAGDRNDGWFLMNTTKERMFALMSRGAGAQTADRPHPFRAAIPTDRNQRDLNPFTTHVEAENIEVGPYSDAAEYAFTGTPRFEEAEAIVRELPNRGYTIAGFLPGLRGNNCNDAVADIIRAYGIDDLPWNQTNVQPAYWFDKLNQDWHRTYL